MNPELEHIWTRVSARLERYVGESTYRIWLAQLEPIDLVADTLTVAAPAHAVRWITDRYARVLEAAVAGVLGPQATVELAAHDAPVAAAHKAGGAATPASRSAPAGEAGPLGNPKLTFDHFVIGDSNRLAHAAALTVAEMPAQAYNPLFICGPPGVGKTHLLSSIANLLTAHNPALTVRLTTGEAFTNAFLGALAEGHTESFKARFRDVDVLLVDDVQFLERKARTEEEFFHTFNALHDSGRQMVLTSDRPPADLQALEERLRERFQSGLVADVKPPELSTRLAILNKRVCHDEIALADDAALSLIAERIDTNVRALEGALIRVVAYSSLTGRAITEDLTRQVLDGLYPQAIRQPVQPSVADVKAAACAMFDLTAEELDSSSRTRRTTWPRQLAMYVSREMTGASLPAIGRAFGGRDHTTVLHACRRAEERVGTDLEAAQALDQLRNRACGHASSSTAPGDRRS